MQCPHRINREQCVDAICSFEHAKWTRQTLVTTQPDSAAVAWWTHEEQRRENIANVYRGILGTCPHGIRATCSNGHCVDQLRQDEHAYYASTTRGYHIPFRTERLCSHCEESINLVPVERNDR